ncbi:uncharacterized protein C2orf78-like [Suncus etruscus]|uniref:uncharacterized protein C2orf78-like n=1 Tax=Suncus etruscus TaxID=109475 RepID=UPI002110BEF4|nr:uncharacterized protein C2orf78-like [Suncus etruscus]
MSENFQNPSALGTANSWQVFVPVVSNAASLAGSACNFSTVSASAVNSAWLLPSDSGTPYQPLMGSAYPYQQINTGMLSGVSGQNQTFTSASSYPTIIQWDISGSAQKKSSTTGGFTMMVTDQDTAVSSMSVAAQYPNIPHSTSTVPLYTYPSLSGRLVKRTPPQDPHHSQSLMLPYQEGSQVHYYNQGTLRSVLSEELGPFVQSYDSMSYTGGRGSALQTYNSTPEMAMILKEVQLTNTFPLASTSEFYNSASAQPITESRFQVMDSLRTQASLGFQPASQTYCQTQNPEFPKSNRNEIELYESNPPPELQNSSMLAPVQSNLALSLAPNQEPTENHNLDAISIEESESLDSHPNPIANKDPLLCPVESPDLHQFLSCFDPLDQEKQVASENKGLGKNITCYEDNVALENDTDSSSSLADITTLEDINCPSLLESLQDLVQNNSLQETDTKENITIEMHQNSSATKDPYVQHRKNKNKTSKPIDDEPQNKIQRKNEDNLVEEMRVSNSMPVTRERSPANSKPNSQKQKVTSNSRKEKSQGQPKTKSAREINTKKVNETRQTGTKEEAEGKITIAQTKHKRNPPEVRQEPLKKPRSSLGLHMLESVQVFHPLGKRKDPTPGQTSSRFLGNSNKTKGFQPSSVFKRRPHTSQEEKGVEKLQIQSKTTSSNAGENSSSSSVCELPPPGKVKLIPLPFFPSEKPQLVCRKPRPQHLAGSVPAASQPTRPGSSSAIQPTAGKSSQPIPSPLADSKRPAQSFSENAPQATLKKPTSPPIAPPETSRPAPVQATFSSRQRDCHIKPVTKGQSPLKNQNQFLLEDFSAQRIPWREPNVPEPVISTPITEEQRPEREAMKRKAQRERYNASKYTSLGKVRFFPQRERDINISLYYGYVGVD